MKYNFTPAWTIVNTNKLKSLQVMILLDFEKGDKKL